MLELKVRAVGCRAARRVDPGAGRPAGARPHQRHVQRAIGIDGEARHPAVEHRDGARLEGRRLRRRVLVDRDLGVREVLDHGGYRGIERSSCDDEHRQRAHSAEVGVRNPFVGQRRDGRHPHPGRPGGVELPLELLGVHRVGLGQNSGGEGVLVRSSKRDPRVGQVGVDLEVAVARLVGTAAGGRDAGTRQRHHEVTRQRGRRRLRRRHHLGHRHRADALVIRAPRVRSTDADACRGGQPEPAIRRVVQRPRVQRGVNGGLGAMARCRRPTGSVLMHQAEAAADHRVADFTDRKCAWHRTWPAQPKQTILADELIDRGLAIDAGHAPPQRENLPVAQHITDAAGDDQPFTQWAAERIDRSGIRRRTHDGPLGQQMPRALAGLRVRGVLVVDGQPVADLAVGDQLATGRGLDQ